MVGYYIIAILIQGLCLSLTLFLLWNFNYYLRCKPPGHQTLLDFAYIQLFEYLGLMNTIFTIEMLKAGYLGFRQFKPSLAHKEEFIGDYEKEVCKIFKKLKSERFCEELDTSVHHTSFLRLTKE